jgi:hypothetical protein
MVKKSSDVVKAVVHKPAAKSTFGTDPKDPWSTKAGIDENVTSRRADLLSKFYKSRGWNVNYISKNKKVAQSKTGDYEKWKRDHGIYESEICSQCQVDPCICDDSHGFIDKVDESYYNNRTGFAKRKREDDEYHNGPDPVKHTYNYTVSKDGGEKHQRTVTTPPTRSAKHEVEHMARNHLEKQGYTIHEESMVEMDKSQTPPGRDGSGSDSDAGKKEYTAKMVSPGKVTKNAVDILQKAFKDTRNKKQSVAEGLPQTLRKVVPGYAKREIDKKMDAGKFGKTDADKDANFQRYKKIQDKLKEQGVAEGAPIVVAQAPIHVRNPKKAQPEQRYMGDIVPPTQPPSTEKRGVKGRTGQRPMPTYKEGVGDPQAATQSPADCANGGEELAPPKKSKAAKMVKEIYSKHRLAEDLYDWEKSDKQGEQYGKAPKVKKTDGVNQLGDKKANAGMILKGGTTLTGQPRDTVEIDPMLKNRTSMPDYKSMDTKKRTKPQ